MSRPGPWHRARPAGFDNPFDTIVTEGHNRPLGTVNGSEADMWGAGARYNFRPRWQDPQGNFVNPENGHILDNWQTGHESGANSVPDRMPVMGPDGRTPLPGPRGLGAPGVPPMGGGRQPNTQHPLNPGAGQPPLGGAGQPPMSGGDQQGGQGQTFPWLQRWTGGFQAPMSPYEQQGLSGLSNFVGGGMGMNGSNDYLGHVLSGDYLSQNNPYFDQIQSSGQVLLKQQQDQAMKEMQSRASAGGNALSGALMGAEGNYLQGSNAAFDNEMAQLRANQYGQERGYQQNASGQLANNAHEQLGGYGSLMGWGATPRNIQTNEMQGQYGDWLRQIGGMQQAYQYPDQMMMSMLGQGNYPRYYQPQFSDSGSRQLSQLMAMLGGSGGSGVDWSGIVNGIGGIFGGSGNQQQPDQAPSNDGHPVHYDGAPPPSAGPSSYKDSSYYNSALTASQNKAAQPPAQPNTGLNAGLGTSALLLQFLNMLFGHGSQGGKKGTGMKFGGGSGGQNGGRGSGSLFDAIKSLFHSNSQPRDLTNNTGHDQGQGPFGPDQPNQNPFDPANTNGNPGPWNPDWNPYSSQDTGGNPGPWAGPWSDTGSGQNPQFDPFTGDNPGPWAPPDDGGGFSGGDSYDFGT